eukprot:jgi/Phyca11/125383/e_gw1.58.56.1
MKAFESTLFDPFPGKTCSPGTALQRLIVLTSFDATSGKSKTNGGASLHYQYLARDFISPFGVVDKGDEDPRTTGRVIHDLSFPDGESVNALTDRSAVADVTFENCSSIAREISKCTQSNPEAEVKVMAGDVASAYRNACTHSACVFACAGHGRLLRVFGVLGGLGCVSAGVEAVKRFTGGVTLGCGEAVPDGCWAEDWGREEGRGPSGRASARTAAAATASLSRTSLRFCRGLSEVGGRPLTLRQA